jgi:hypothetical protein
MSLAGPLVLRAVVIILGLGGVTTYVLGSRHHLREIQLLVFVAIDAAPGGVVIGSEPSWLGWCGAVGGSARVRWHGYAELFADGDCDAGTDFVVARDDGAPAGRAAPFGVLGALVEDCGAVLA